MKYFNFFYQTLFIISSIFLYTLNSFALVVQPNNIKLTAIPGGIVPFKIAVRSDVKGQTEFEIQHKKFYQFKDTGEIKIDNLTEQELQNTKKWFKSINHMTFNVKKDHPMIIEGNFKVPPKACGTKIFALSIASVRPKNHVGIFFQLEYIVKIELKIANNRCKQNTFGNIENISITNNKQQLIIAGDYTNTALDIIQPKITAFIRDAKNNRLIEKRNIIHTFAHKYKSVKASKVYPKTTVVLWSELLKIKKSGTYSVIVMSQVKSRKKIIAKQKINVDKKMLSQRSSHVNPKDLKIRIEPNPIKIQVQKNLRTSSYITLYNDTNYKAKIKFYKRKSKNSVKSSKVNFRPKSVTIRPRSSKKVMLTQIFKSKTLKNGQQIFSGKVKFFAKTFRKIKKRRKYDVLKTDTIRFLTDVQIDQKKK